MNAQMIGTMARAAGVLLLAAALWYAAVALIYGAVSMVVGVSFSWPTSFGLFGAVLMVRALYPRNVFR